MSRVYFAIFLLFASLEVYGQHHHPPPSEKPKEDEKTSAAADAPQPAEEEVHHHPRSEEQREDTTDTTPVVEHASHGGDALSSFFMSQASGTSLNPASAPMHMTMKRHGDWSVMLHGMAFVSGVVQTGPRGDDEIFSTNWMMATAERPVSRGRIMGRAMLSLEPLTVSDKFYPELFQTGEIADGHPIVDGQHPHDLFMEIAAQYAQELSPGTIGYLYVALHGDPTLGPVAFPHRSSAMELPQASLGHHVQDSSHIASTVVTAGVRRGMFGFEGSIFRGEEPDEERWNIDLATPDSWSVRLTYSPTPSISAQVSTGHLEDPEAHEPGDVQRTTASFSYAATRPGGVWATSLIFGRNDLEHSDDPIHSWLGEALFQWGTVNYLTARLEAVDKNELFPEDEHSETANSISDEIFQIKGLTVGYTRDVFSNRHFTAGVGGNVTLYDYPSELDPFYGDDARSYYLFLRLRSGSAMSHGGM